MRPPNTVAAGKYKVVAKVSADDATATSDLALDITGQPKIDVAGREGVLSAKASAGQEASIPVILSNSGTAPAEQIELSGSAPSGWKVSFEPKAVDRIAPNETKEVQALVTPAEPGHPYPGYPDVPHGPISNRERGRCQTLWDGAGGSPRG